MAGRIDGKRTLVTGAANGIGLATARRFAAEGASVALLDVEDQGVRAAAEAIAADGGTALPLVADVTDEDAVERAFAAAVERFGGLDVVVANAGIEPADDDRIDRLELAVIRRVLDVNLVGMFLTCKHAVRALLAAGGGSLICTSSPTGLFGVALGEHAYSASKAGVHGLARVMAAELAPLGIRVNAVVPGFTATRLNQGLLDDEELLEPVLRRLPAGRPGRPEEIASMMLWLASDESSFAVGGAFTVDGGETAV